MVAGVDHSRNRVYEGCKNENPKSILVTVFISSSRTVCLKYIRCSCLTEALGVADADGGNEIFCSHFFRAMFVSVKSLTRCHRRGSEAAVLRNYNLTHLRYENRVKPVLLIPPKT